jgi:hypothetical protein
VTHDYKRNGTTTLFAALNTLEGKVVGECHATLVLAPDVSIRAPEKLREGRDFNAYAK